MHRSVWAKSLYESVVVPSERESERVRGIKRKIERVVVTSSIALAKKKRWLTGWILSLFLYIVTGVAVMFQFHLFVDPKIWNDFHLQFPYAHKIAIILPVPECWNIHINSRCFIATSDAPADNASLIMTQTELYSTESYYDFIMILPAHIVVRWELGTPTESHHHLCMYPDHVHRLRLFHEKYGNQTHLLMRISKEIENNCCQIKWAYRHKWNFDASWSVCPNESPVICGRMVHAARLAVPLVSKSLGICLLCQTNPYPSRMQSSESDRKHRFDWANRRYSHSQQFQPVPQGITVQRHCTNRRDNTRDEWRSLALADLDAGKSEYGKNLSRYF